MKPKFVHEVCSCGCTKLKVPFGIGLDQLILTTTYIGKETIRFTVELEMQPPMHGWKPYNP